LNCKGFIAAESWATWAKMWAAKNSGFRGGNYGFAHNAHNAHGKSVQTFFRVV
jgi:hypothetical protein